MARTRFLPILIEYAPNRNRKREANKASPEQLKVDFRVRFLYNEENRLMGEVPNELQNFTQRRQGHYG